LTVSGVAPVSELEGAPLVSRTANVTVGATDCVSGAEVVLPEDPRHHVQNGQALIRPMFPHP